MNTPVRVVCDIGVHFFCFFCLAPLVCTTLANFWPPYVHGRSGLSKVNFYIWTHLAAGVRPRPRCEMYEWPPKRRVPKNLNNKKNRAGTEGLSETKNVFS